MRKRILPEEWSYCSIKGNLVYFNELSETSLWWKVSKFLSEAESIFDANGTSSIEFRREFEISLYLKKVQGLIPKTTDLFPFYH